jgi:hypothetical protein
MNVITMFFLVLKVLVLLDFTDFSEGFDFATGKRNKVWSQESGISDERM